MADLAGIAKEELENYIIDSNKALELKLVRCPDDIQDESSSFEPDMSHQVYGDSEQIFGYTGLKIQLYYSASRLTTYLSFTFQDKVNPKKFEGVKPDEIILPIAEKLPPGYLENIEDFTASLKKDEKFKPFGEMKHRFTAETEDGEERVYDVYMADSACPGFLDYHRRMEMFILWYIDAASFIDADDEKWRFFVVYEKYIVNGSPQYAFVGYTTVYEYYAYPENKRPRVSQMLVLPPFQRMGIGAQMLETVYKHYWSQSNVIDITVEDPSENFVRIRDYVDSMNCLKLESFKGSRILDGISDEMVKEAQEKLKISKKQIRRVYEILRLRATDLHNQPEYKKYRLYVKNRLNAPYRKEDDQMVRLKRRMTEEEFKAATMTITSKEQRMESLENLYTELETHYKAVIERLDSADLSR